MKWRTRRLNRETEILVAHGIPPPDFNTGA
jgi:hypothetical protein